MKIQNETRPLWDIAKEIRKDWRNVNYAARPYLEAMASLESVGDSCGYDSGDGIIRYFLCNASQWRGENAKSIKAELKGLLK